MGKGSRRRNEDTDKVRENWDRIFGNKDKDKPAKEEDSKKTK